MTNRPAAAPLCEFRKAWSRTRSAPSPKPLPVPRTSPDRLAEASEDAPHGDGRTARGTVLYLAYGSNLSSEKFLGARGMHPISQVNVSVPLLRLTFDLPGLPYAEPSFANVAYRKLPDHPEIPDPPTVPPIPPPTTASKWGGELMGVVYELTPEDYQFILADEGGGASYLEVTVPCLPIPPKMTVPEKPPIPELPRPFLAKTLYAPILPNKGLPDDPDKGKSKTSRVPSRPEPEYAQPSPRYLKLITDGAAELDLPDEYQAYLNGLQGYTRTTMAQEIGRLFYFITFGLVFLICAKLNDWLADENGVAPAWLRVVATMDHTMAWWSYDHFFKSIFGDGERTQEKEKRAWLSGRNACAVRDEEKMALLSNHD